MSVEQHLPILNVGPMDKPRPSLIISPSNGIEDESSDGANDYGIRHMSTPTAHTSLSANIFHNELKKRSDDEEPPQSAIHAPAGFTEFKINTHPSADMLPSRDNFNQFSDHPSMDTESIPTVDPETIGKKMSNSPISPPPLTTNLELINDWPERATPRAQTRHDFDDIDRRSHSSNLEDIPEGTDSSERASQEAEKTTDKLDLTLEQLSGGAAEIRALQAALVECWSLCNTLATLSYIHRERLNFSTTMQEDAWKSCWRLCQQLYDCQVDDHASQVNPTLDLCRDFCQTLFEIRARENEIADSVLRVSFELNNHLYNTHDRNLPDAFRERTLDFYITLCHRLMKQRTRVPETDSLLSSCWALAEMLFSIRQSKKEGRQLDEELLGSAVQACWELCDIFREGWTQRSLRNSDRGTPRPSQAAFAMEQHARQPELSHASELPGQSKHPETPTTIFEDIGTVSPDEATTQSIFVLGQGRNHTNWSSNSSSVSGITQSSEKTSSTNTVITLSNDSNVSILKVLIAKAAIDSGFQRSGSQTISSFVKSMSSDAFGSMPWQISLLKHYKKLVSFDPAFRNNGPQGRVSAVEVARAVQSMIQSGQHTWLRDLYRLVFGFHVEEATNRNATLLQV